MRAILIFDNLNDVLFVKCDKKFASHILKLAKTQGLLDDKDTSNLENSIPSPNIIMQLFSPIVTSQHLMASQFGNSYTSMKFQDGTNMVFDEYIGYTFMYIAAKEIDLMRRTIGVGVSIVRHVCGPDVAILKTNWQKACLVSSLLDAWSDLRNYEQSMLIEAIEQLSVNTEVASSVLKVLHDACDKLKSSQAEFSNLHMLILVGSKFLSLYSSKNAHDLCASDILLMILLCSVINKKRKRDSENNDESNDNDILLPDNSASKSDEVKINFGAKLATPTSEDITDLFKGSRESSVNENLSSLTDEDLYSQLLLLGCQHNYTANTVHIFELSDSINLITIVEATNLSTSSGLCDSFHYLDVINNLQFQRAFDELKPAFENLDGAIKKTKWDFVRKKYNDLLRSRDPEVILQIEANTTGFVETLKELLRLTCFDRNFLKQGIDVLTTVDVMKNFPVPGILCGDYYRKLTETCFPKFSPNKVRIYELYCVHLGLTTSTCVLEHSRRLAATIWEVTGIPNNFVDIF
ncbi:Hermansky-Pudlak syndrome 1 protein [Ooceraea biroi]|uniref:Hermansky-Pudlak syndrome 1 protein n=1 Tax=Ooceraea biroi TaxID=2015173 RepID=A0A026WB17_OOCBI|nr:Hermansky-Pudlak syndrome 1 protein [Ooceraea biroi]